MDSKRRGENMKKIFALMVLNVFLTNSAFADDVKIGILLGFTGPIESLTPDMASGAELAIKEASDSGAFMGGSKILSVRGDSTCVDAAAATATAERLITSDGVSAIMGADCSGVTTAVLQNVATAIARTVHQSSKQLPSPESYRESKREIKSSRSVLNAEQ